MSVLSGGVLPDLTEQELRMERDKIKHNLYETYGDRIQLLMDEEMSKQQQITSADREPDFSCKPFYVSATYKQLRALQQESIEKLKTNIIEGGLTARQAEDQLNLLLGLQRSISPPANDHYQEDHFIREEPESPSNLT